MNRLVLNWETKKIFKLLFWTYLILFAFPFYWSQMIDENDENEIGKKHTLLKICMFRMVVMLIAEITKVHAFYKDSQRKLNIWDFYGIFFVVLFFCYAIPELNGVFSH